MSTKNIFAGFGLRSEFVNLIYTELIQEKVLPFGEHDGQWYGEVRLTIEPNRELRGRILLYGKNLEVISPQSLRDQIIESLKKQITYYL